MCLIFQYKFRIILIVYATVKLVFYIYNLQIFCVNGYVLFNASAYFFNAFCENVVNVPANKEVAILAWRFQLNFLIF